MDGKCENVEWNHEDLWLKDFALFFSFFSRFLFFFRLFRLFRWLGFLDCFCFFRFFRFAYYFCFGESSAYPRYLYSNVVAGFGVRNKGH